MVNKDGKTKAYCVKCSFDNILEEGFKRPIYWNEYQAKIKAKDLDDNNFTRFFLEAAFQEVKRLFVLAFDNTEGDANKVEKNRIYRRNFYDQRINDLVKQYDEIRKIATGQGDDYTTC